MEPTPKEIRFYVTEDGNCPFAKWLDSLRDKKAGAKIRIRLDRLEDGNFGDFKSVGNGVFELRIDYAQGYCVYFGMLGSTLVILLFGGNKSTQDRDILKSQEYWQDYRNREVE